MILEDGYLIDLGTIGGGAFDTSAAYALSNTGDIVGQTTVDFSEPPHAFLYRDGAMSDLGTDYGDGSFSRAWDINSTGQVVGERSRT